MYEYFDLQNRDNLACAFLCLLFRGFSSLIGYSVLRIFHPYLYFVLQNRDNPGCHVSSAHRLCFLRISHLPLREDHIFKQTGEKEETKHFTWYIYGRKFYPLYRIFSSIQREFLILGAAQLLLQET
jgi:hypothetical protein